MPQVPDLDSVMVVLDPDVPDGELQVKVAGAFGGQEGQTP